MESSRSRFAIIPILRGRGMMKSHLSDRLVDALRDSGFCSKNPLVKGLVLRNVRAYCVVVETSGTHSLKVIVASVPYLLALLSRANPKLKKLLEGEQVSECVRFFREADTEALLESLCTAKLIVQRGLEACYPTLCVTLSRDALLLCTETWKWVARAARVALSAAVRFAMEDLWPAVHSVCARNREIVTWLSDRLPAFALAGARGMLVFSFLVRRVFRAVFRTLRRFAADLRSALLEKCIDVSLWDVFEQLYGNLKRLALFVMSAGTLHYLKYIGGYVRDKCIPTSKNFLMSLWDASVEYMKRYFPLFKKFFRNVVLTLGDLLSESNLRIYANAIYSAKPLVLSFFALIEPHYANLCDLVLRLCIKTAETGRLSLPYIQTAASLLSKTLIRCIVFTVQNSLSFYNAFRNALFELQRFFPAFKTFATKILRAFLKVFKTISSYVLSEDTKNMALGLHRNMSPHLYSAAIQLNSSLFAGSTEIVRTSFHGSKRVVPSVLSAIRTVAPHTLHAISELILSSRDSAVIVYPTLLKAAVAVHPDVRRSMSVVLQDGSTVLVELASASYTASCHLVLVTREVSNRLPLVLRAIEVVTTSTIDASNEVLSTSSRARSRLTSDLRAAGVTVTSSMEGLERELRSTLDQVALEINSIVSDNPEVGYFYRAFIKEEDGQASLLMNDKINYLCYLSFLITTSSIGLARRFHSVFSEFFQNYSDDDEEKRVSFFSAAFCRVVDSFDFGGYLHLTYENLMGWLSSVTYCVVSCIRSQMSISYSEFCERVLPDLWQHFKRSVSALWRRQCEVADELWTFLEKMSAKMWELTQRFAPNAWSTFKAVCLKTWLLACQVSPGLWDFLSSTTIPLMWNYNREVVRTLWKAYLRTCSDTWKVLAPLTSSTWECTLSATPKVWVAVSENSKHRWQVFCDATEQGYESVTGVGASAWDALNKIVSSSWSHALRPATLTACCTTSSILAKSIKLSHITYTKTGKFLLLCIELPGSKFQSMKVEILSSKKASATRDILKKCVTFSNENLLAPGSKRKLAYKAIKEVTDCFKMDNIFNNLVKMYKIPLIPVTRSCAFGQDMYKRYSSSDCFQESFLFPSCGSDGF